MSDAAHAGEQPDLDLVEYVMVSARDEERLAPVARAVVALARSGSIRLLDAVLLVRDGSSTEVESGSPAGHEPVSELAEMAAGGLLLSPHDIQLAAVTLAPGEAALLLLVEDLWAASLSDATHVGGARLTGGERIAPDRVRAALDRASTDLIVRTPGSAALIDQVAQIRQLARLVDRGLLPLDRYEVQRRRVLGG